MKIYNVLIETNDTDNSGEVLCDIYSFSKRESAVRFLSEKYGEYTSKLSDDEKRENTTRNGDDEFCIYYDDILDEWTQRGTIYPTDLIDD